jgi:hypothetical protein
VVSCFQTISDAIAFISNRREQAIPPPWQMSRNTKSEIEDGWSDSPIRKKFGQWKIMNYFTKSTRQNGKSDTPGTPGLKCLRSGI